MTVHDSTNHEHNVEIGSDRSFGLVVGGILCGIGAYLYFQSSQLYVWLVSVGTPLLLLGVLAPKLLRPLNVLWFKLGMLLGSIVTPVVMFVVYVISIVPIGLLLRLTGKDLLFLRNNDSRQSYWIEREPPAPSPESLKDQF